MSRKLFTLFPLIIFLCMPLVSQKLYGKSEGKTNTEIDLPIARPEIQPSDDWFDPIEEERVVFVIDTSGSMYGTRISKAKAELTKAIQSLPPNVEFDVIFFSCTVTTWKSELVTASEANKQAALGFVSAVAANGGTGTGSAVKRALELNRKNKLVVLLTDGAPNCIGNSWGSNSDHLALMLGANQQKAQIDVYAIQPYSGSYKQFCQEIAQRTGGKYREVN